MKVIFTIGIVSAFCIVAAARSSDCEDWFQDAKIAKNSNCLQKCAALDVDMTTSSCYEECDELCGSSVTEQTIFRLSDLYPGLTATERALAATS